MTSITATSPSVQTVERGTIALGAQTFQVAELLFSAYVDSITGEERPASAQWQLTGARGGVYFLRGFLGTDTGVRQVISWKSGQPLRVKGNEVRVVVMGDMIEKL